MLMFNFIVSGFCLCVCTLKCTLKVGMKGGSAAVSQSAVVLICNIIIMSIIVF